MGVKMVSKHGVFQQSRSSKPTFFPGPDWKGEGRYDQTSLPRCSDCEEGGLVARMMVPGGKSAKISTCSFCSGSSGMDEEGRVFRRERSGGVE